MLTRLLSLLMALWLLAGLQLGSHVHHHDQGGAQPHSHVVSKLNDADHALAHAQGAVDEETDQTVTRVAPALVFLLVATLFLVVLRRQPVPPPAYRETHVTGPPPHWRPPSQAPPGFPSFA